MDVVDRNQWRQADKLFATLIELEPAARATALDKLQIAPEIRTKLNVLLANTARGHRLLDAQQPGLLLWHVSGIDTPANDTDPLIGRCIGDWRLIGLLGRGGMAAVYRAQRTGQDYQQQAALKLLGLTLRGPADHARFRRERQILASLQHPHITSLIDGGIADDGTPYLVMGLVAGVRIDEYCDAHGLDVPARVQLMLQVSSAVAVAHRQLVVHRDIKPGNILVDDAGHATLLDFGIAHLLDDENTGQRTATRAFTPDYAAPEQRAGEQDVGTTADVYGLGAVLHRLVTGQPPQQDAHGDPISAARVARDNEREQHSAALRGDLDAIIMRALATDPQQRYVSVDALSAELQNWLQHRPVRARQPGPWGRFAKLVRRNPVASAATAAALLVAAAGLAAVLASRSELKQRAAELQAVAEFQSEMLEQIDPQAVGGRLQDAMSEALSRNSDFPTSARDAVLGKVDFTGLAVEMLDEAVLSRATRSARENFAAQPRVQAMLLQTLASSYRDLFLVDMAKPLQHEATTLYENTLGTGHRLTLASMREQLQLADLIVPEDGEAMHRRVLALHERYLGRDDADTALARAALGAWLLNSDPLQSEALLREALEQVEKAGGSAHADAVGIRGDLAVAVASQDRFADAEPLYRKAIEDARSTYGTEHALTLDLMTQLAWLRGKLGHPEQALAMYRKVYDIEVRVFGEGHPRTLNVLNNLAWWPRHNADYATAEPMQREAYEGMLAALGAKHPVTLRLQVNMADVCLHLGKFGEAETLLTGALEEWTKLDNARAIPRVQRLLGKTYLGMNRHDDAQRMLDAAWQSSVALDSTAEQRWSAEALRDFHARLGDKSAERAQWQTRLDALAGMTADKSGP